MDEKMDLKIRYIFYKMIISFQLTLMKVFEIFMYILL